MPVASTRAFILSSAPFAEQDKLIHLLTLDRGILKAIAPGAQKAKNRFGSLFELFTEGEFFYYWKETKELITISKGDITRSHFNLVSEVENIFYFHFIAEVLLKLVPYNHKEKKIYRLMSSILKNRDQGIDMDLLLLYFLIWILRIEGLMFNARICYNCFANNIDSAWLKLDFRGILCQDCHSGETMKLKREDLAFIKWTEDHSPAVSHIWKGKIATANLIRMFTKKIEHHCECLLKSAHFLKEFH